MGVNCVPVTHKLFKKCGCQVIIIACYLVGTDKHTLCDISSCQ